MASMKITLGRSILPHSHSGIGGENIVPPYFVPFILMSVLTVMASQISEFVVQAEYGSLDY